MAIPAQLLRFASIRVYQGLHGQAFCATTPHSALSPFAYIHVFTLVTSRVNMRPSLLAWAIRWLLSSMKQPSRLYRTCILCLLSCYSLALCYLGQPSQSFSFAAGVRQPSHSSSSGTLLQSSQAFHNTSTRFAGFFRLMQAGGNMPYLCARPLRQTCTISSSLTVMVMELSEPHKSLIVRVCSQTYPSAEYCSTPALSWSFGRDERNVVETRKLGKSDETYGWTKIIKTDGKNEVTLHAWCQSVWDQLGGKPLLYIACVQCIDYSCNLSRVYNLTMDFIIHSHNRLLQYNLTVHSSLAVTGLLFIFQALEPILCNRRSADVWLKVSYRNMLSMDFMELCVDRL